MWRRLGVTLAVAGSGAGFWVNHQLRTDPSHPVSRSFLFWTRAAPALFHYRAVEYWCALSGASAAETDARFEALHEEYASRVSDTMLDLRGVLIFSS
jgi:hypothetical protein